MSLSQKQFHDFKKVCEEFYEPTEDLNEELFDDICDELIDELIEEGYSEEDAVLMIEDAANDYIDEAKVTFGHDTQAKRASGAPVGARRRFAMRKAGDAMKKAGDAVKGAADRAVGTAKAAKAGVEIAGTIAKDEMGRAGRKAAHSATKAADAVKSAPGKARDKAKKGIKGFIKRQAEKVVKRMSEENVEELYKGKHGQTDKQYADSRSQGGKMVSGDSKMSGAEYTHGRRVKAANPGMQPDVGGKTKPKSQGKMDKGTRADLEYRKANLKKEELDIFDVVLEFLQAEGYAETLEEAEWMMANLINEEAIDIILGEAITSEKGKSKAAEMIAKRTTASGRAKPGQGANVATIKHIRRSNRDGLLGTPPNPKVAGSNWPKSYTGSEGKGNKAARRAAALRQEAFEFWLDEAMSSYDRNRKRAAQRAADRNAARAAGKTGVVPGVGYVSPRKERETYTDEKGTVRHKSGAKMP